MIEPLKIAIDIDEILADTLRAIIIYDNNKYRLNHKWEDFHTYRFWEVWGCTKEESVLRVSDFFGSEDAKNILPISGSIEGIETLSKKYYLHSVTGRPEKYRILTNEFIEKYHKDKFLSISYTAHYYEEKPIKKYEVCKRLNAKIIIEDDLEHAIDCADNGIIAMLLDRPWNRGVEHENIIRVNSWDEIVKNIENINKKIYNNIEI